MIILLQIAAGLVVLYLGGEFLVKSAVVISKKLGIATFIIGLTVVAYGTSSPELVVSIKSALNGYTDITLGNVVGSNISNVLCVLGLSALIFPPLVNRNMVARDSIFMLACTLLLYVVAWLNQLNFYSGILFITILAVFTWFVLKSSRGADTDVEGDEYMHCKMTPLQAYLIMPIAIGFLVVGSDLLVEGAVSLAQMMGVSEASIGLTIVAFGSSLPEIVTSVIAALHRQSGLAIGNIIGSNIFNIIGILGITTLISPIEVTEQFTQIDIPVMVGVTLLMVLLLLFTTKINRMVGGTMFASYASYIALNLIG